MANIGRIFSKFVIGMVLGVAMTLLSVVYAVDSGETYIPDFPVWDGTVALSFAGGDGTRENPYLISDGSELALLMKTINDTTVETEQTTAGVYYKLTNDIILNDISDFDTWDTVAPENKWTPGGGVIDYISKGFAGYFDGGHYDIYGLYVDTNSNYGGLFGLIYGGQIKNFNIKYAYVSGGRNTGGLVGYAYAKTSAVYLSGCRVENAVVKGTNSVGGVCGNAEVYGKKLNVDKCSFDGEVVGSGLYIGGIVGLASGYGVDYKNDGNYAMKVTNCINSAYVSGGKGTGGIVGSSKSFTTHYFGTKKIALLIENCINSGEVISTSPDKGGIIGTAGPSTQDNTVITDIINCVVNINGADVIYGTTKSVVNSDTSKIYTLEQMLKPETYTGFDFAKIWNTMAEGNLPWLRIMGDSRGDKGKITARDVIDTLGILIGEKDSDDFEIANIDFNNDGVYTLNDLNSFIRYVKGKGATGK